MKTEIKAETYQELITRIEKEVRSFAGEDMHNLQSRTIFQAICTLRWVRGSLNEFDKNLQHDPQNAFEWAEDAMRASATLPCIASWWHSITDQVEESEKAFPSSINRNAAFHLCVIKCTNHFIEVITRELLGNHITGTSMSQVHNLTKHMEREAKSRWLKTLHSVARAFSK